MTRDLDLSGQLLIAMPGMGDPRFDNAVIFICSHTPEGAMGLIVNKPSDDVDLDRLLEQLDIDTNAETFGHQVFFGGPVETGRGFILHSIDYTRSDATMQVDTTFSMTATRDILEDISMGRGPDNVLATLGYSGWSPGQLEDELAQNAWLTVEADQAIVFSPDHGNKWTAALAKLGVNPLLLSSEGGHA